jgi:hypothetical protein
MDQFGSITMDQYGFKTDKNGYKINKNLNKFVYDPHILVNLNESVKNPHKSVGAYVYFIEGHIPIEAIEKLLTEKPEIDGIALPEMPSGSPGMPGFKLEKWKIHSVKNAQDQGIFMEI